MYKYVTHIHMCHICTHVSHMYTCVINIHMFTRKEVLEGVTNVTHILMCHTYTHVSYIYTCSREKEFMKESHLHAKRSSARPFGAHLKM